MKRFWQITACIFTHKKFWSKKGEGDWMHVHCPKCDERWVHPR